MDGKSRWADNIMIERWFRSLKTELIYIIEFSSPRELRQSIRSYIEQYFCLRNIRFIAVNKNFDAFAPEDAHAGIIIPLRNMINEAYALDIGRKIKAQQRQTMQDGKFIGSRTPLWITESPG